MIAGLYRRPVDVLSPACDPIDPLEGALPTWRMAVEDEPTWLEVVALLGDPLAVSVDVEVIDEVDAPTVTPLALARDDDAPTPVAEPDDAPPTRALRLVTGRVTLPRSLVDEPVTRDACPDCGATGLDPCRPKSNPAGKALTRWHRRRRLLAEREAGRGEVLLIVLVVALVLAVAGGAGTWLSHAVDGITPCVASTASGMPVADCSLDPAAPTGEDTP